MGGRWSGKGPLLPSTGKAMRIFISCVYDFFSKKTDKTSCETRTLNKLDLWGVIKSENSFYLLLL